MFTTNACEVKHKNLKANKPGTCSFKEAMVAISDHIVTESINRIGPDREGTDRLPGNCAPTFDLKPDFQNWVKAKYVLDPVGGYIIKINFDDNFYIISPLERSVSSSPTDPSLIIESEYATWFLSHIIVFVQSAGRFKVYETSRCTCRDFIRPGSCSHVLLIYVRHPHP
jgi:hypothetical protein